MNAPKTLQEAIAYFADPERAFEFARGLRWPDGKVTCPRCSSDKNSFIRTKTKKGTPRYLWFCYPCDQQFTLKVGTVFEDSAVTLDKWMTAFWMLVNCRNGVSSWEIHRTIGVTQKTAWFMLQRLRLALQEKSFVKLGGPEGNHVEVDETFIGGKARNMHKSRRQKMMAIGRYAAKTAVMGMLERGGRVRTHVLGQRDKKEMQDLIRETVVPGTWVMTDEFVGYDGLSRDYTHLVTNHLERYVHGNVHTQGIENFWSLLKRGLGGTYVAVEPFHLFRYVDEQAFRFNTRKDDEGCKIGDAERFALAMSRVAGHRLTYAHLTGKDQSPRHEAAGPGPEQVPF